MTRDRWLAKKPSIVVIRQFQRSSREEGNAVVEFILGMLVLVLPTLWLVMALASVQASIFAAESASREAARILAADATQEQLARVQAEFAFSDFGLSKPNLLVSCDKNSCEDADVTITVTVTSSVRLPMIPEWSGLNTLIPIVSTTSTAQDGVFLQ